MDTWHKDYPGSYSLPLLFGKLLRFQRLPSPESYPPKYYVSTITTSHLPAPTKCRIEDIRKSI